jgi:enamine deaminase RidA (YjgF/YER057c/UK114 family)
VNAQGVAIGGKDIEAQADQAFQNFSAALQSVGCDARHLVKLTVFIRDMEKLADYRRAHDRFFKTVTPLAAPAITLVEVSRLFSDELLIEIERIAAASPAGHSRRNVSNTDLTQRQTANQSATRWQRSANSASCFPCAILGERLLNLTQV